MKKTIFITATMLFANHACGLTEINEVYWQRDAHQIPSKNSLPWDGQKEFLERYDRITKLAQECHAAKKPIIKSFEQSETYHKLDSRIKKLIQKIRLPYAEERYRGISSNPYKKDEWVYGYEYTYEENRMKISWDYNLGTYVRKFNVRPSDEFVEWVMNNPDGDASEQARQSA